MTGEKRGQYTMKLKTLKMVLTKSAAIAAAAGMILTSAVPAQADTDGTIQSITADDGSSGITATVSGQEETVGDDSASGQPGTQETGEKTEDSAEEASGQQSADNAGEESGQQTSESTGQESGDKTADSAGKESGQKAAESKEEASVSVPYTAANTTDIYRMYNSTSGEHLYTSDTNERNVLLTNGWTYEGQGWTSPNKGVNNAQPVYRLYNPAEGGHLYTMDAHERDVLAGQYGWNYEGIGWYSDAEKSIPVYREFNPGASKNGHNFTASETEDRILVSQYHFNAEGIAWYAVPDPDPTVKSPVTIYKGTDFSAIYDFSYYWNHYTDVQQSVGRYDDAGTLKHFVETGLKEGRQAKESCDQTVYDDLKNKLYNPYPEATAVLDQIGHNLHVESIALLERVSNRKYKPDARVKIDVDLEDYYRIKDAQKN